MQLEYPFSNDSIGIKMLDFICVGAHKSGTTWLHENLSHHPDVWLPPFKELHHFDQEEFGYTEAQRSKRIKWFDELVKKQLDYYKKNEKFSKEACDLLSWGRQFSLTEEESRTDDWYQSLFPVSRGEQVSGEITPAYALLSCCTYQRIKLLNPKIKIIFMIREPSQRVWSSYRFDRMTKKAYAFKQRMGEYSFEDFVEYANRKAVISRTDYLQTIRNIRDVFDSSNIKVLLYDNIVKDPSSVMLEVCNFIGVDYKSDLFPDLSKKQLSSKEMSKPKKVDLYLKKQYQSMVEDLGDEISLPKDWLV